MMGENPTQASTNRVLYDPIVRGAFSGNGFLDEDTMASDSATKVASQQSIKAYTDARTPLAKVVRKSADETVNGSTTLQNDDVLKLAVTANQVWQFTLTLLISSSAVADFKMAWTVPTGTVMYWADLGHLPDTAAVAAIWASGSPYSTTGANPDILFIQGIIVVGANAGDVQLQWAQNTLEASDTKVLANSCLSAVQIA